MNSLREDSAMRLFQHKNGYWYAELNRQTRISLKTKDRAQAQRLYRQLKKESLADRLRLLEGRPPSVTLSAFFEEYLEFSFKTKAKFTHQTDGVAIRQFLRTFPDNLDLGRITTRAVEQWHFSLKVKPSSANVWFRHLKAAFGKAKDWGYLKENPFIGIRLLKVPEAPDRYLTDEDIESICQAETDLSWRLLWLFLVKTGVRRSEALQVKAPIDFDADYIALHAKGGKLRRVYLTNTVKQILSAHPVQVGLLWPWKPDSVTHHFAHVCKMVGIKARLHDLRHTYASNEAMSGKDLRVVQKLLGHADFKTTQRYEHLTPEFLKQVLAEKSRKEDKLGA